MGKTVLVVDDSTYMRLHIKRLLSENGYDVIGVAKNGETAIDMALELEPEIITLDNILPDMTGIDVLKVIKQRGNKSAVIMVSAVGQQSAILEGMNVGASEYIIKPFEDEVLLEVMSKYAH